MKMTGAQILLEMLNLYEIEHVFGLPGETTLNLYKYWRQYPAIKHILVHDERSAAFMAEAYAKVAGKVGVSEAPSPGAAHPAPGVLESYTASVPTICFTSDVPYNSAKRNMLSGFDQNALYSAITKESLLATRAADIPYMVRRAFRVALADRPGAVHVCVPMDVYGEEAEVSDLYADPRGSRWPASRPVADFEDVERAIALLAAAKRPVIVCGQGALTAGAGEAVRELAEILNIPVGCTMTAKGTISETHPLSIRLIGSRGGTSYANHFLETADLVFFVGSNTDSAGTNGWRLPDAQRPPRVIQLDISGVECGNNYPVQAALVGDARATIEYMTGRIRAAGIRGCAQNGSEVGAAMKALDDSLSEAARSEQTPVSPLRFVKELQSLAPDDSFIALEPSIGGIFAASCFLQERAGRKFISNYSQGALGYMIPAALAVSTAHPDAAVIGIGGDGSFHFSCGELETCARLNANVKLVICRNDAFGWIKGETSHVMQMDFFAADFGRVDYAGAARAFGLKGYVIDAPEKIAPVLKEAFANRGPALIELWVPDESSFVPPVPRWVPDAKQKKLPYFY